MLNQEMIRKTEAFLKEKFDAAQFLNAHPENRTYRIEHTYRVANIGRQIAREEGFDETEMVIACLLHDVAYCEEFGENGWKDHGRRSAEIARPFLEELGLPQERIDDICYGIAIHVDDDADYPGRKSAFPPGIKRTPFALTVGDADNIDRFDAYRIHEMLCRDGFLDKSFEEKQDYTAARIARLRELREMPNGTKAAEKLWRSRLDFYIEFYEKLADQLASSKSIIDR